MTRIFTILLVLMTLTIGIAIPGYCTAQKVVMEGGPYTAQTSNKIEEYKAQIQISQDLVNQPLYLTFYNGYGAKHGYSWVRVFLNAPGQPAGPSGNILADERTFLHKNAVTVDVSGMLSNQGNALFIEGEGETGASFTWVLSTVKNQLTLLDSTSIKEGKPFSIHGTGFSTTKEDNQVLIAGKPAKVIAATSRVLTVQPPDGLDTSAKNSRITVSVNGQNSNSILAPFVMLPPTLITMSPYGGPVGGVINLRGTNFSPVPANNVVQIGPYNAPVIQVMDTGTLLVRIPNWGGSSGTLPVRVISNGVPSTNYLQFWCIPWYYGGDPNAAVYHYD